MGDGMDIGAEVVLEMGKGLDDAACAFPTLVEADDLAVLNQGEGDLGGPMLGGEHTGEGEFGGTVGGGPGGLVPHVVDVAIGQAFHAVLDGLGMDEVGHELAVGELEEEQGVADAGELTFCVLVPMGDEVGSFALDALCLPKVGMEGCALAFVPVLAEADIGLDGLHLFAEVVEVGLLDIGLVVVQDAIDVEEEHEARLALLGTGHFYDGQGGEEGEALGELLQQGGHLAEMLVHVCGVSYIGIDARDALEHHQHKEGYVDVLLSNQLEDGLLLSADSLFADRGIVVA